MRYSSDDIPFLAKQTERRSAWQNLTRVKKSVKQWSLTVFPWIIRVRLLLFMVATNAAKRGARAIRSERHRQKLLEEMVQDHETEALSVAETLWVGVAETMRWPKCWQDISIDVLLVYTNMNVCIVLYCLVLSCLVLYCIVLYCLVLYCIVLYCIVL